MLPWRSETVAPPKQTRMIPPRSSRGLPRTTIILASPAYRGSFTAALKNLLDHLPIEPLAAKPVGIVAMGATSHHYLGMEWHLRDVLA